MTAMYGPGEAFLPRIGVSKDECIDIAKRLADTEDILPVRWQGFNSFTLRGRDLIVQFRERPMELDIYQEAMEIHKGFVPSISCKQTSPYYIYIFEYGGAPFCSLEFELNRQKISVQDLAIFLAQSWNHPVSEMTFINIDKMESFLRDCLRISGIEEEVQKLLDNLRNSLGV
jgi:hypothetical protein